ncbi:hypothetical protein [Lunatibacter salilacus]|uniref:hypothetical protein n=1 Tax=Lunatibacter salilacus TaxID=2483804 RepID=UPI0018FEBF71|nr:hypothetical protein [Lunatibacter salilacus]
MKMNLKRCCQFLLLVGFFGGQKTFAQSDLYRYGAQQLPATDALGRSLPTFEEVGPNRPDKYVGIFYWTWHTQQSKNSDSAYNVMEILDQRPEAINDYLDPIWPTRDKAGSFFWAEPLFGYYLNTDKWVLYKHAEMLADAGVDMVMFDCTNGSFTWKESYLALAEVFTEARKNGIRTPQIAFMMAFGPSEGSLKAIKEIYHDMYEPGIYQDLWFYWKGKPLIMAYPESLSAVEGDPQASKLHQEIREFFTFRPGQPVYNKGPMRSDHWGWLEIFPQNGFVETEPEKYEQVTVGVSQNWSAERGLTAMNAPGAFGRSYTAKYGHNNQKDVVNEGLNFQEQWDRALEIDPEMIFITGWNEWIAGRYDEWQQQHNAFPDQFDHENSRDIEPMKGGHTDNYYYQMAANIRRFKGMRQPLEFSAGTSKKIDGKFGDWDNTHPEFKSHKGNTLPRNSPGWGNLTYENITGRNDITAAKVSSDEKYIYFYVNTANPLTPKDDPGWMRLFIDVDRNRETGWEGYDFVVNRKNPRKRAKLEKSSGGWKWSKAGKIDYSFSGNEMELRISKKKLGIKGSTNLEFKWSDNMQEDGDITDFLINGDVAPLGRFNFFYYE